MYKEQIQKDGFVILKSVFSPDQLQEWNTVIQSFLKSKKQFQNHGGILVPDFVRWPALAPVASMKKNATVQSALRDIFGGDNFRYCNHNDIGINRISPWHKDKLNGPYSRFQVTPIWSTKDGEKHEIVKMLVYLQDHSKNKDGLWLVPGSHLTPEIHGRNAVYMATEPGDVILFDQRINHRGMDHQVPESRTLVSFGFGRNNLFTDEFEAGTLARQNDQNNAL